MWILWNTTLIHIIKVSDFGNIALSFFGLFSMFDNRLKVRICHICSTSIQTEWYFNNLRSNQYSPYTANRYYSSGPLGLALSFSSNTVNRQKVPFKSSVIGWTEIGALSYRCWWYTLVYKIDIVDRKHFIQNLQNNVQHGDREKE